MAKTETTVSSGSVAGSPKKSRKVSKKTQSSDTSTCFITSETMGEPAKPKKRGRPSNKDAKEYIDNALMTATITEWVGQIKGIEDRKNWPQMPNYLGECFLKIVNNYGNLFKFRNYTYLDDMKSEALLTCIKYAHNFNPEKSKNAFSYFTQITHFCFLQIIAKEKHQTEIKMKKINEMSIYNYNDIKLESSEDNQA